ncbi:hypothetical protein GCM10028802_36130 [Terrabacter terrigena]
MAVACVEPVVALRPLSAADADGEAVRVRSPPEYTVRTSAASGAGAPATRMPFGAVVPTVVPLLALELPWAVDLPAGAGSDEQAASVSAATADTQPVRSVDTLRERAGRHTSSGRRMPVGRWSEVTAPP